MRCSQEGGEPPLPGNEIIATESTERIQPKISVFSVG